MEEKYDAVCCECGAKCQVPFKPKNPKTVKCKDCYNTGVTDEKKDQRRADTKKVLRQCKEDVEEMFPDYSEESKRALISGLFISRQ